MLTTGALIKRKGTEILIQGFAEALRKTDTKLVLKIVGDGPQRAYLEELVRSLHIDSHVIFCGHHDHKNMPAFYRNANVFISMSRAESWGQMYLEAMSSGLAILTTRNDGSTFIINNKINGVFVKTENSHDLAKKIVHLATNRELLRSLQKSARATALEYDWEKKIIPKYVRMYKNLLDS